MKRVKSDVRVAIADSISDTIVRIYKDEKERDPAGIIARDQNLAALMADLEKYSHDITIAIKRDKTTVNREGTDSARGKLVSQLVTLITGYTAFPDEQKQAAARKLLAVTSKYKGLNSEDYATKGSLIESMLRDFEADELAADLDLLDGVRTILSNIRAAQDEFYKASDRMTAQAMNKVQSATSIKKPLLATLNDRIVPYLTALEFVDGYKLFIARCELEITKVNNSLQKKKAAEEPTK